MALLLRRSSLSLLVLALYAFAFVQQSESFTFLPQSRPRITIRRLASSTTATNLYSTTSSTTIVGRRIPINENYPGLKRIRKNPDVFIISEFLDENTCQYLVEQASQTSMEQSPVAYAGWTQDFKDLIELCAKGPIAWIALIGAWFQEQGVDEANQVRLVIHALQNYFVIFVAVSVLVGVFTYSRAENLKSLRTSTSTTLDDLHDPTSGTTQFVQNAAQLFSNDDNNDNGNDDNSLLRQEAQLFEAPTVIRYEPDQILAPHYDANRSADTEDANRGGQTLATLLVYLNDVEKGGLTKFGKLPPASVLDDTDSHNEQETTTCLTFKPKLGDALLFFPADAAGNFDDRLEHEGCQAVDEKWIARIWRHKARVPPPFGLSEENLNRLPVSSSS